MDINQITKLVKNKLSPKRFEHTLAVMKLTEELAQQYDVDIDHARLAAVLHDITKEQSQDEQLHMIEQSGIILDNVFYHNENLHHGITAYLYAKDVLSIDNIDVLNAIRYHTTANDNMSMLEKIIYVADACSYDRTYENAQELRELSFKDIDQCIFEIIEFTVCQLLKKRTLIAIDTINCYNTLLLDKGNHHEKSENNENK